MAIGRVCGAGVLAVLALTVAAGSAGAVEVEGSQAVVGWVPAQGPVEGYAVFVARDGANFEEYPEQVTQNTLVAIDGEPGETVEVRLAAFDEEGNLGPFSRVSEPIRFLETEAPPPPSADPEPGETPPPLTKRERRQVEKQEHRADKLTRKATRRAEKMARKAAKRAARLARKAEKLARKEAKRAARAARRAASE